MEQTTITGDQPNHEQLAQQRDEWVFHAKELERIRLGNAAARETNDAVEDMSRVRAILMEHLERTQREAVGLLRIDEYENTVRGIDPGVKAIKLARAVRQSIVLQQELMGCRPVPVSRAAAANGNAVAVADEIAETETNDGRTENDLRDRERCDLIEADDIDDYDDRPYDQVIAGIHDTLSRIAKPRPMEAAAKPAARIPAGERAYDTHFGAAVAPTPDRRERGPPLDETPRRQGTKRPRL